MRKKFTDSTSNLVDEGFETSTENAEEAVHTAEDLQTVSDEGFIGNSEEFSDPVSSIIDDTVDEIPIIDETDFGGDTLYVQEGVYINLETGIATVEDEVFDGLVDEKGYYLYDTGSVDKEGKKVVRKLKTRRYRRKKKRTFDIGILREENFGELLPLIKDENITDINWNGFQLWVDDIYKGRYLSEIKISKEFVDTFSVRVSNVVSRTFNKYTPSLEAETEDLRVTVVHESVSHTGRAISIRKTPAIKRIDFFKSIADGDYCTEEVANLMSNAIKAKMNVIVCGLPGVGKTELVKFLTNYIFPQDRAITVEDTLEIHYKDINPGKDCLELKISDQFSYTDAIKASLRLLPQWVLLSEARSTEVQYLIESVSTGTKCITTLHSDDVRKIPDRVVNMIGDIGRTDLVENSVYNFFDVGILIDKKVRNDGRIHRWISQLCLFVREGKENRTVMLVDDGKVLNNPLPAEYEHKFKVAGIDNPYAYTYIQH